MPGWFCTTNVSGSTSEKTAAGTDSPGSKHVPGFSHHVIQRPEQSLTVGNQRGRLFVLVEGNWGFPQTESFFWWEPGCVDGRICKPPCRQRSIRKHYTQVLSEVFPPLWPVSALKTSFPLSTSRLASELLKLPRARPLTRPAAGGRLSCQSIPDQ